jgi:hypothetical protein
LSPEIPEETWPVNAMWDPRQDPRIERNTGESEEI